MNDKPRLSIYKDCSNCFYNLEENFSFYPCADCIGYDSWQPIKDLEPHPPTRLCGCVDCIPSFEET